MRTYLYFGFTVSGFVIYTYVYVYIYIYIYKKYPCVHFSIFENSRGIRLNTTYLSTTFSRYASHFNSIPAFTALELSTYEQHRRYHATRVSHQRETIYTVYLPILSFPTRHCSQPARWYGMHPTCEKIIKNYSITIFMSSHFERSMKHR